MSRGLKVAEPPRRRSDAASAAAPDTKKAGKGRAVKPASPPRKFAQVQEGDKVQFNKRVTRGVADGYEMLAIKTRRKVPDLLAEALELLEKYHGKV